MTCRFIIWFMVLIKGDRVAPIRPLPLLSSSSSSTSHLLPSLAPRQSSPPFDSQLPSSVIPRIPLLRLCFLSTQTPQRSSATNTWPVTAPAAALDRSSGRSGTGRIPNSPCFFASSAQAETHQRRPPKYPGRGECGTSMSIRWCL